MPRAAGAAGRAGANTGTFKFSRFGVDCVGEVTSIHDAREKGINHKGHRVSRGKMQELLTAKVAKLSARRAAAANLRIIFVRGGRGRRGRWGGRRRQRKGRWKQ